jgi:Flp pilus assembly protein TadG
MRARLRSLWRDQRGTALLEGAIVTPFLCILCFGVYEFSNFFYKQHLVSTGVRDAARYLGRVLDPKDPYAPTTAFDLTPSYSDALPMAQNLATTGITGSGGTLRVKGWDPVLVSAALDDVPNPANTYHGPDPIWIVTVSTDFTPASLGFMGFFGFTDPPIRVRHQERVLGPR